jgi:imidazole glycerol-phosphate synthase subunit HisH
MIAIVDYGLGNIRAFANIYASLDIPFVLATEPSQLQNASRAILPGVGAFDQAMLRLNGSGMRDALDELVVHKRRPVLGVCVGMQMLATSSAEGSQPGLGWIDSDVVKFDAATSPALRVPHMGWNDVHPARADSLFQQFDEQPVFYFLHSYFVRCHASADVLATTTYGAEFACAVNRENIYGVQFHPEKSHQHGIQLLKNFASL